MSILRIATAPAELTTFGGDYTQTANFYDSTRTRGTYRHGEIDISTLIFPQAGGTTTWMHFNYGHTRNTFNPQFWSDTVFELRDSNNLRMFRAHMISTMQLRMEAQDGVGGIAIANTAVLSDNLSYSMDIKIEITGGNVNVEIYFNSALQGSASISNAGGCINPDRFIFGLFDNDTGSGSTGYTYFSEIMAADEDTRGFRLRELTPQSFGVFQQWAGTVASVIDDSLATGVSTDVNGERVSFGLDNLQNIDPGDIINRVVAQSYAQRGPTGLTQFAHFFRYPDTTVEVGPSIAATTLGAWYVDEYTNNPDTAAAWLPADLAGIQLGLEAQT